MSSWGGERGCSSDERLSPTSDLRESTQTCYLKVQLYGIRTAAPDTVAAAINQGESRAGGSGSPGGLRSPSPPSPQERAPRSSRGIHSCTCIRRWPDTESFSIPSSLCFLPLVFPMSVLNRRFQEEHSAQILSGFTAHPALRALSRRAPLQPPVSPPRCPAHRQPGRGCSNTSSAQGSHRRVRLIPPAAIPLPWAVPMADSHRLLQHRPKTCRAGLLFHTPAPLQRETNTPQPGPLCTGGPTQPCLGCPPGHMSPRAAQR